MTHDKRLQTPPHKKDSTTSLTNSDRLQSFPASSSPICQRLHILHISHNSLRICYHVAATCFPYPHAEMRTECLNIPPFRKSSKIFVVGICSAQDILAFSHTCLTQESCLHSAEISLRSSVVSYARERHHDIPQFWLPIFFCHDRTSLYRFQNCRRTNHSPTIDACHHDKLHLASNHSGGNDKQPRLNNPFFFAIKKKIPRV